MQRLERASKERREALVTKSRVFVWTRGAVGLNRCERLDLSGGKRQGEDRLCIMRDQCAAGKSQPPRGGVRPDLNGRK